MYLYKSKQVLTWHYDNNNDSQECRMTRILIWYVFGFVRACVCIHPFLFECLHVLQVVHIGKYLFSIRDNKKQWVCESQ